MSLPPELDFHKDREASPARMNRAMEYLLALYRGVAALKPDLEAQIELIHSIGLARLTEKLQPVFDEAQAIRDTLALIREEWVEGDVIGTAVAPLLVKAANLADLVDAAAARQNLGLGTLATQDGDVAALALATLANVTRADARAKVAAGSMAYRNLTVGLGVPEGGVDGDVHFDMQKRAIWYNDVGTWRPVTGGVPPRGTLFEGGYFGGFSSDAGVTYALIVSPKATGFLETCAWKTTRTDSPGTSSYTNGPANTAAMANATHPAANFCAGLIINGYSDWYLPAPAELLAIKKAEDALLTEDQKLEHDSWTSMQESATDARGIAGTTTYNWPKDSANSRGARAIRRVLL